MADSLGINWFSSIRTKISIVIIVPVFLLMSGFSAYSVWEEFKSENKEREELASVSSDRMANHLGLPMWDLDNEQVQTALLAEMKELKIHAIAIWDSGKEKNFEAKKRNYEIDKVINFNGVVDKDTINSKSQIIKDEEVIGEVTVHVKKASLYEIIKKSGLQILIAGLVLIFLLVIILSITINKVLIKPIVNLSEQADAMSKGQLDQKFENTNDEIGYLSKSLGRMQSSMNIIMERFQ